ncbi:MAG: pilus assembly protein [Sterolibacteriaceae bacterium]|nr:pilus assembly protein [Sterolibacteriaceae bacterium]MBK9085840.1 pilus assembly protein [Sterolibacteriaceae bacterium]
MQIRTSLSFSTPAAHVQRGAALLAALIFLIVFTIIGVGVVGTTTTEEKLARNFRDVDIAFAAAEAALRDAEIRITGDWSKPALPVDPLAFGPACPDGLCDCLFKVNQALCKTPIPERYSMASSPSVEIGTGTTGTPQIALVSAQPRYFIEKKCANLSGESSSSSGGCPTKYYQITTVGSGRLSAQTTLQETFIY